MDQVRTGYDGYLEQDVSKVTFAFRQSLRIGTREEAVWAEIAERCRPGPNRSLGRTNYREAFEAFTKWADNQGILTSVLRQRFKSLVQKLIIKAEQWDGLLVAPRRLGLKIQNQRQELLFMIDEKSGTRHITPEETVEEFYRFLNERKFDSAWAVLDSDYQVRRWKNDPSWFSAGYTTMQYLQDVRTIAHPDKENKMSAYVDVLYEEQLFVPVISVLAPFETISLSEAQQQLPVLLQNFASEMKDLGASDQALSSLNLSQLLRADAAIAVPWELGISHTAVRDRYPKERTVFFQRARRVHVTRHADDWRIRRIGWLSG